MATSRSTTCTIRDHQEPARRCVHLARGPGARDREPEAIRSFGVAPSPQGLKSRVVRVVATNVPQQSAKLLESSRIEPSVLCQAIFGAGLELTKGSTRLGYTNDGNIQMTTLDHSLQRGEDLLIKISRGAEEYKRIAMIRGHEVFLIWQTFPGARRIRTASPTAAYPGSRLRRAR
jgi:hypothetical protein